MYASNRVKSSMTRKVEWFSHSKKFTVRDWLRCSKVFAASQGVSKTKEKKRKNVLFIVKSLILTFQNMKYDLNILKRKKQTNKL